MTRWNLATGRSWHISAKQTQTNMAKNNEENVAAEAAAPEAEATATATETAAPAPQTIILTSPTQDGLFHAFLDLKKEHKDSTKKNKKEFLLN